MSTSSHPLISVAALIRHPRSRAILLQRRRADLDHLAGAWDVVGGKVEPGETILDALKRETYEETGWILTSIISQLGDRTYEMDGHEWTELCFLVAIDAVTDTPALELDKYAGHQWFTSQTDLYRVEAENTALGLGDYIHALAVEALKESQVTKR